MNIPATYFSGISPDLWLALFPLTYVAHVAEEYCCKSGYSAYLLKNYNVELSPTRFLVLQGLGLTLMILSIILAVNFRFSHTMSAILGSTVLVNGLAHGVRRVIDGRYGPGLVTGLSLWIPLGIITLLSVWETLPTARFVFALALGVVINGVVELISIRGGRLLKVRY